VALRDIAAVEADENYAMVCLGDGGRLLVRRTLKTWEETLPASHFVRVHRGTIVNLARYRGSDRESEATTLLHLEGLRQPVTASYRYLAELRARLLALGRQLSRSQTAQGRSGSRQTSGPETGSRRRSA
jgi:two-component system LytT family response regulator